MLKEIDAEEVYKLGWWGCNREWYKMGECTWIGCGKSS